MDVLLGNLFPQMPTGMGEWFMYLSGILGAILLIYAQFVEAEHRRDLIRVLGGGGLFVYAYYIFNLIFMVATAGIVLTSLIEFIEIYMGYHKHTPEEVKEYIKKYKKKK